MKKIALISAIFLMAFGAKAQDCEAIMLPYFGGDASRMEQYRSEVPMKYNVRCAYARAAFYVSDTIPAGADVYSIADVTDLLTGNRLSSAVVIDLNNFSYYRYDFKEFQVRYPSIEKVLCFTTPGSEHPYLVLRSIHDMMDASDAVYIDNPQNR